MDSMRFKNLVEETNMACKELLNLKGGEYSTNDERLSNFKKASHLFGITPLQVSAILAHKHFDAICRYITNDAKKYEQILSEPIEGRIHDLINYMYLILAIIEEQNNVK